MYLETDTFLRNRNDAWSHILLFNDGFIWSDLWSVNGCCCGWNILCIFKHSFMHSTRCRHFQRQSLFPPLRFFKSCARVHWCYSQWYCFFSSLVCSTKFLLSSLLSLVSFLILCFFSLTCLPCILYYPSILHILLDLGVFSCSVLFFYLNYLIPEW